MKFFLVVLLATAALASPAGRQISDNDYVSVLLNGEESDLPDAALGVKVNEINEDGTVKTERILPKENAPVEIEAENPPKLPEGAIPELLGPFPLPPVSLPAIPEAEVAVPLPDLVPFPLPPVNLPAIPLPGEVPVFLPFPLPPANVPVVPAVPEIENGAIAVPLPGIVEEHVAVPIPELIEEHIAVPIPELIEEHIAVPIPEFIEGGVALPEAPRPQTGEVYSDDLVSVTLNAPEDEGVLSRISGWFSMIINSFKGGESTSAKIL